MKKRILTGDRPTGKLHLGHFVGSLKNRVLLQDEFEQFLIIADLQALTDNFNHPEKLEQNILNVAIDYLACGIDPKKSTIFIQSMIPQISELTKIYANLVTVSRLSRNPTVKDEIKQKNFKDSTPVGFFIYPISQAADITFLKANLVPVGTDQLPMIEQTREIVEKFNKTYNCEIFPKPEALVPKTGGRLVGIDGQAKMGKSLNNGIFLGDSSDKIKQKVMQMYTDPNHVRIQDPGKVEGNVVFTYLDIFGKDKEKVEQLKQHYKKGGLGDVEIKKYLIDVLENFIAPIRTKRIELEKNKDEVKKIILQGTEKTKSLAEQTMKEVKTAMKMNYFKAS